MAAGLVVVWLKVEGVTALGLPVLSVLMLAVNLNEVSPPPLPSSAP